MGRIMIRSEHRHWLDRDGNFPLRQLLSASVLPQLPVQPTPHIARRPGAACQKGVAHRNDEQRQKRCDQHTGQNHDANHHARLHAGTE